MTLLGYCVERRGNNQTLAFSKLSLSAEPLFGDSKKNNWIDGSKKPNY